MSDFKAKMHKIRFPLGLCPRPYRELTVLPQPPGEFKGVLLLRGRERARVRGGGKRKGKDGEGSGGEGREGEGPGQPQIF